LVSYIFQQLSQRGKAEGIDRSDVEEAREWFRQAALDVRTVNRRRMMNDKQNIKTTLDQKSIGKMYTFFYDPKHKQTLPYYDLFPLIFLVDFKDNGFL